MNGETREKLAQLRAATGGEYGKLIQKLLAIAFLESGVSALVERSTQGIDLEMTIAGERLAMEVKTSDGGAVKLSAKDIEGLDRLVADGAQTLLAVLLTGPLEDWIFATYYPHEFSAGRELTSFRLRAYRDKALEARVGSAFDQVVDRHLHVARNAGQKGLTEVMQAYAAWARA